LKSSTWEGRYEWINNKKAEGNKEYKRKNLNKALNEYINGLLAIEYDNSSQHTDKLNGTLRLDLINNVIATLIELEHYNPAVIFASTGLSLYPNNLKMLMRRGKSYLRLLKYEEA